MHIVIFFLILHVIILRVLQAAVMPTHLLEGGPSVLPAPRPPGDQQASEGMPPLQPVEWPGHEMPDCSTIDVHALTEEQCRAINSYCVAEFYRRPCPLRGQPIDPDGKVPKEGPASNNSQAHNNDGVVVRLDVRPRHPRDCTLAHHLAPSCLGQISPMQFAMFPEGYLRAMGAQRLPETEGSLCPYGGFIQALLSTGQGRVFSPSFWYRVLLEECLWRYLHMARSHCVPWLSRSAPMSWMADRLLGVLLDTAPLVDKRWLKKMRPSSLTSLPNAFWETLTPRQLPFLNVDAMPAMTRHLLMMIERDTLGAMTPVQVSRLGYDPQEVHRLAVQARSSAVALQELKSVLREHPVVYMLQTVIHEEGFRFAPDHDLVMAMLRSRGRLLLDAWDEAFNGDIDAQGRPRHPARPTKASSSCLLIAALITTGCLLALLVQLFWVTGTTK